jgi:ABC-type antimicrobial peptide transport system permease subunit
MKNFLADLRFGLRMLRKSPGFALTMIAMLALGIGANAAVFSVVDAVLLRSLPLRDPERVVMLWEKNPALGGSIGVSSANAATYLEVVLVMISIVLVACLVPAWRAIRVNPMMALRDE